MKLALLAAVISVLAGLEGSQPGQYSTNTWENSGHFEGDILLSPMLSTGIRNKEKLWPGRTMYFSISSSFTASEMNYIVQVINSFLKQTCVNIKWRTNQPNYIFIKKLGGGCSSYIGMIGGEQELKLGRGCLKRGTIYHELLHAFGLWHMQNSPYRDHYVTINYDNIIPAMTNNFLKRSKEESSEYGVPYDYKSVMHYSKFSFSKNGLPTIVPKNPLAVIGKQNDMSPSDILRLHNMYNCRLV